MKKHLVLLSALLLQVAAVSVFAQDKEYVDLGLSVKWATCNEGATTPLEVGYYYNWNSNNLLWNVFKDKAFQKAEGDITKLQQGEDWRTPSNDEMIELLSYCTWTWVENADSCGFKVTSNIEGFTDRSIFFPILKTRDPVYEIVSTSNGGHQLSVLDSTYHYTGNYMTNFISGSIRPGYLRLYKGHFAMFKNGEPLWDKNFIRPVKPLNPQTKQNRVLPQVELIETNFESTVPILTDISDFEGLGITLIDEGLQW